jgi:hypothetical protein
MRNVTMAAILILLSSSALAQQAPSTTGTTTAAPPPASSSSTGVPIGGAAPEIGSPQYPGSTVGLSKLGDDGVSTKTVRAVPCSTAARETDGFTTCIGIPERGSRGSRR